MVGRRLFFITNSQIELVYQSQKQDEQAFYELINPLQDQLYRIALIYVQNENDAVHVFQQSVIRAYEGLHNLKEPQVLANELIQ